MGRLNLCPICGGEATSQFRKGDLLQFAYEHCGICGGYKNSWREARLAWNNITAEWISAKGGKKVDRHTATECAYKNGFAAGLRAAERHAKWIKEIYFPEADYPAEYEYICSLCGRYEGNPEPYCNCGARMDLEE